MRCSVPGITWIVSGSTCDTYTALRRPSPSSRVTVELRCSGMPKSSRHCTTLRRRPDGCGINSCTPTTSAPCDAKRRAMISPMSPDPRITARRPGRHPWRFMKFCALPAENTPDGREPARLSAPSPRSREPVASTTARAAMACAPRASTACTVSGAPSSGRPGSTDVTLAPASTSTEPASASASISRCAYSGPVSSTPKRCSPNPLCTHCLRMPPSFSSRSSKSTRAPCCAAAWAAAMPAAPPPATATS